MLMFNRHLPSLERSYKGSRFELLALGRTDVRDVAPDTPYLVISVTDPDKPEADIPHSPLLRGIIRLKFDDIAEQKHSSGKHAAGAPMSREDGRRVLRFVRGNLSGVKLIVCQCEEGASRSAAMAAALSRILQGEDEFFFQHYWPNRWVYNLLLEEAKAMCEDAW